MRNKFIIVLASLVLFACGDDAQNTDQHFVTNSVNRAAGNYRVQLNPIATDCQTFAASGMVYNFSVAQFGQDLTVTVDDLAVNRFGGDGLILELPPFGGQLFNTGGFRFTTQGNYAETVEGFRGYIIWDMTGTFTQNGFQGFSDTQLFDPALGFACTVSHAVEASRR